MTTNTYKNPFGKDYAADFAPDKDYTGTYGVMRKRGIDPFFRKGYSFPGVDLTSFDLNSPNSGSNRFAREWGNVRDKMLSYKSTADSFSNMWKTSNTNSSSGLATISSTMGDAEGGGENTTTVQSGAGAMSAIPAIGNAFAGSMEMLTSKSTATTGKQAAMQSIADINTQTINGAQAGMAIGGPWGALIGGAIGTTIGLVGRKGSIEGQDYYNEGTLNLGTGLRGIGNGKLRRKYNRNAEIVRSNKFNAEAIPELEYNFAKDYDQNGIQVASGGIIPDFVPTDLSNGEIKISRDGTVTEVGKSTNKKDGNDTVHTVSEPGDRIISNKLTPKGSDKSYAQIFKQRAAKMSKGKGRIADNTNKLNEANNLSIANELFKEQEANKSMKKRRSKVQKFAIGGDTRGGIKAEMARRIERSIRGQKFYPNSDYVWNGWDNLSRSGYVYTDPTSMLGNETATVFKVNNPNLNKLNDRGNITFAYSDANYNVAPTARYRTVPVSTAVYPQKQAAEVFIAPVASTRTRTVSRSMPVLPQAPLLDEVYPDWENNYYNPGELTMAGIARPNQLKSEEIPGIPTVNTRPATATITSGNPYTGTNSGEGEGEKKSFADKLKNIDWEGLASSAAEWGAILPGLFADYETANPVFNPNRRLIERLMRDRRIDPDDYMKLFNLNRAIDLYNQSQVNPSTGANMAYALASANALDRTMADTNLRAREMNNQYAADFANVANNLGVQSVQAINLARDITDRRQAAAQATKDAARRSILNKLQRDRKDSTARAADSTALAALEPYLKSVFTDAEWNKIMQQYKKDKGYGR